MVLRSDRSDGSDRSDAGTRTAGAAGAPAGWHSRRPWATLFPTGSALAGRVPRACALPQSEKRFPERPVKKLPSGSMLRALGFALFLFAAAPAPAAVVDKANNASNLNAGVSWAGGATPGTNDTGQWSATVTASNAVALGGNLSWQALRITNPGGDVTLLAGNTLTLLSAGTALDLGSATRDLEVRCALAAANDQTWNVAAGRTLRLLGGVAGSGNSVTRNGGGTLLVGGGTSTLYDLNNGGGTLLQTGGVLTVQNYYRVANYASATSIFRGGSFTVNGILMVGYGAGGVGGTMVVTGSASVTAAEIRMSQANTGRLSLDGGTLSCSYILDSSGQSEIYFNGGKWRAREDRTDFLQGLNLAEVRAGGVRLEDQGHDLTIAQPLLHATALGAAADGGFSKSGAGTLTLTATNTFTGPATLSAGTLALNGILAGTGAVSVLDAATLTGSGALSGAVTVADGGTFAPAPVGSNAFAVGSLCLSNAATLKVTLGGAGGTNAPDVAVAGNLTLGGQLWIVPSGTLATGGVWTIVSYGGALTNRGLAMHPMSAWAATVDTNLPGRIRVVLTRANPFIDVATNCLSATGTTAEVSVDLHGVTTNAMWYEGRDAAGRLWDFGAHPPSTPWPFHVRHLREGTNTVTVFARTTGGTIASNQLRIALALGRTPAARPRPFPAEVWWGGSCHQNIYSNGAIVGTTSQLSEFLGTTGRWDFVKSYQDGFFLHGYVWVNNAARMTNWVQVGQSLAAQLAPYRTRFWLENGWRPQTNNMGYGHSSASGQRTDVADLESLGLVLSETTQDYNPMAYDFSKTYPAWPQRDLMALGTGDTNGVSASYPYTTGQWRDYLLDFHSLCPHVQVGWTWSPVYFHWKTGAALADDLIFSITNGPTVYPFNYDFYDFMVSAQRKGAEASRTFGFASDCPWGWFGAWGDPVAGANNRAKIRAYETWLQTNGMRHTLICNDATSDSLASTPDVWDSTYKTKSLSSLYTHQLEGGRALRYLFESWYAGPYTILPETKSGSYANLAMDAIKYLKGIRDTNGTLDQLTLTNVPLGAVTNRVTLKNLGEIACLPALNAFEYGADSIAVRYFASNGVDITSDMLSPDGWSPTNLLAAGATLPIVAVATLPAQIGRTNRQVYIEACWNPQDPSGLVRDRVSFSYGDSQPDPWAAQDIGAAGVAGTSSISNGVLTIQASGADIWGASDEFQFFYAPRSGDGAISARIVSQEPSDPWAKAGVMMRESLASNAAYAAFFVTPSNGLAHQSRLATGAGSTTAGTTGAAPCWLRLTRNGLFLQSFSSTNGTNWTYWRTTTLSNAGPDLLWGIAVSSHNDARLCRVVADNLSLNSTPDVTTTPTNYAVTAGATLSFPNTATDFDAPGQTLSWSKAAGPAGATVDAASGLFVWRPAAATAAQTTTAVVRVTDDGIPPLTATQVVQLVVAAPAKPSLQSLSVAPTGISFTVSGSAGPDYVLAASTNLVNWSAIATASNATPPVTLRDTAFTNFPRRFYRIQLGP